MFVTDVKCDYIVAASNILIDQQTVSYIDSAAFLSCHPLYDGDMEQWTCTDQGTWDGVVPTCQGISLIFILATIIPDKNIIDWASGIGCIMYINYCLRTWDGVEPTWQGIFLYVFISNLDMGTQNYAY